MNASLKPTISTLALSFALIWLLTTTLSTQANVKAAPQFVATQAISAQPVATSTPIVVVGEPCGHLENLLEQSICLYGSVLDSSGIKMEGAIVTVSNGDKVLTDTTSLDPNESAPSYSIDLSPLTPTYLQPLTVTASANGITVVRVILAFPDYRTHNQHFDLRIPATSSEDLPSNAAIWGYVYDYAGGAPTDKATVIAERNGISKVAKITTDYDPQPIYYFSTDQLSAPEFANGDPAFSLTLHASVNSITTSGEISYAAKPMTQNFLAGWPCDTDGVLPGTGGGKFGLPGTGGGKFGLPDDACLYGTVYVDKVLQPDVYVYIDIGNSKPLLFGVTKPVIGGDPRYAIRLESAHDVQGKMITLTAVYQGYKQTKTFIVTLDQINTQLVDLAISTPKGLGTYYDSLYSYVYWCGKYLWLNNAQQLGNIGTITRFDPIQHEKVELSNVYSFPIICDGNGRYYWFGGSTKLVIYDALMDPHNQDPRQPSNPAAWTTLTQVQGLVVDTNSSSYYGHMLDTDGTGWFGTGNGINRIRPTNVTGTFQIVSFTLEALSMTNDRVLQVQLDVYGNVWVMSDQHISRIDGTTLSVTPFSTSTYPSITGSHQLQLDPLNNVWVFAKNGLNRIAGTPPFTVTPFTTATLPLPTSLYFDQEGNGWALDGQGISRIDIKSPFTVTRLTTTTIGIDAPYRCHSVSSYKGRCVYLDDTGNIWLWTNKGVSRIDYDSLQPTTYLIEREQSADDSIDDFQLDRYGNGWYTTRSGVSRIDHTTLSITNFTTSTTTLINNPGSYASYKIRFDHEDNPWVMTNLGVSKIDTGTLSVKETFTISQLGLPGSLQELHIVSATGQIVADNCMRRTSIYQSTTNGWKHVTLGGTEGGLNCFDTFDSPYLWVRYPLQEAVERPNDLNVQFESIDAAVNGSISYTVHISNTGEAWVAPTLIFTAPKTSRVVAAQYAVTSTFFPLEGVTSTWQLAELPPTSGAITVTVQVAIAGTPGDRLLASASVTSTVLESFQGNNNTEMETLLLDRRADVRVAVDGPTVLQKGNSGVVRVWLENAGGFDSADTVLLVVHLPPQLSTTSPTSFDWPTLAAGQIFSVEIPVIATNDLIPGTPLPISAEVSASNDSESNNNSAQAYIPTDPDNIDTLFVVAGQQMISRKGHGASAVLNKLYQLAQLPEVKGAVLDVLNDTRVQQQYEEWNKVMITDSLKANEVAGTVKLVLTDFISVHTKVRYVVFVGGDEIIPFYRVADGSETFWQERIHGGKLPPSSVGAALAQNNYLTDDCYLDAKPEAPQSPLWKDKGHLLCIPDRVSSRLVENPDEIIATINTFLQDSKGKQLSLTPTIMGGDAQLTYDTVSNMCTVTTHRFCGDVEQDFDNAFASTTSAKLSPVPWSSAWSAFHSNQNASGAIKALDIRDGQASYSNTLWINIGCHVGLNVPDSAGSREQKVDLAQTFTGKSGTLVASTAYGYATRINYASYSEKFMATLHKNLTTCSGQTIGAAFIHAKHQYYAEGQRLLDYLDEKSIEPLTLYGLPMWQVTGGTASCTELSSESTIPVTAATVADLPYTPVTVSFVSGEMPLSTTTAGSYYTYAGQVLAQDRRPVQPQYHIELSATLTDVQALRGVVLLNALYEDKTNFDPLIEEAWILAENDIRDWIEPRVAITGWDHNLPYSLGLYPQLPNARDSQTVGRINLVLGACNAETTAGEVRCQPERLFTALNMQALYSNDPDTIAPTYTIASGYVAGNTTSLVVNATDDQSTVATVIAICDDNRGHYVGATLQKTGDTWFGNCAVEATRFYVQVVDSAGNVTNSEWRLTQPFPYQAYLPVIMHDYSPPLPDMIVADINTENKQLSVAIRNIGEAPMADNIWIHLCIDPVSPLVRVNDVCKGRSYEYLVWAYPGRRLPILPDQTVTLLAGGDFYTPTFSVFSTTISIGTKLWAHVDSTNANSSYGGTLESHERDGKDTDYNNILGPISATQPVNPPFTEQLDQIRSASQQGNDLFPLPIDLLPNPPLSETQTEVDVTVREGLTDSQYIWLPMIVH